MASSSKRMKNQILIKAEELFLRYGIRSITMNDIAVQLGISKKTIYQHFPHKEAIVLSIVQKHLEHNKQNCLTYKQTAQNAIQEIFLNFDAVETLLQSMNPAVIFDLKKYHPAVFEKFLQHKNNFLYQVIYDNLVRGIKTLLYRKDIQVEVVSRFFINNIVLNSFEWFPTPKTSFVEIEQELKLLFLHGIATAQGLKIINQYTATYKHHQSFAL